MMNNLPVDIVIQSEISKKLGCDKAMSAKIITKFIKLGYLYRIKDIVDARAFKVYLTEKAKEEGVGPNSVDLSP